MVIFNTENNYIAPGYKVLAVLFVNQYTGAKNKNIICSREVDRKRYDTRSKGLFPHGNITYNFSFL